MCVKYKCLNDTTDYIWRLLVEKLLPKASQTSRTGARRMVPSSGLIMQYPEDEHHHTGRWTSQSFFFVNRLGIGQKKRMRPAWIWLRKTVKKLNIWLIKARTFHVLTIPAGVHVNYINWKNLIVSFSVSCNTWDQFKKRLA